MKVWFVRSMLIAALPLILCWAFFAALYRGIKDAFWYAAQEVRIEIASFRRIWNTPLDAR